MSQPSMYWKVKRTIKILANTPMVPPEQPKIVELRSTPTDGRMSFESTQTLYEESLVTKSELYPREMSKVLEELRDATSEFRPCSPDRRDRETFEIGC